MKPNCWGPMCLVFTFIPHPILRNRFYSLLSLHAISPNRFLLTKTSLQTCDFHIFLRLLSVAQRSRRVSASAEYCSSTFFDRGPKNLKPKCCDRLLLYLFSLVFTSLSAVTNLSEDIFVFKKFETWILVLRVVKPREPLLAQQIYSSNNISV